MSGRGAVRLCSQRFGRVQTANETGFRLLCVHLHQTKPKGATLGLLSPRELACAVNACGLLTDDPTHARQRT